MKHKLHFSPSADSTVSRLFCSRISQQNVTDILPFLRSFKIRKANTLSWFYPFSSGSGSTQHTMDNDWLHTVPALGSCSSYGNGVKGHRLFGVCQFKVNVSFTMEGGNFEQACLDLFSRLRCSWRRTTTTTSSLSLPTKLLWSSASPPTATIWSRSKPWVKVVKEWPANPSTSTSWVSSLFSSFNVISFCPWIKYASHK